MSPCRRSVSSRLALKSLAALLPQSTTADPFVLLMLRVPATEKHALLCTLTAPREQFCTAAYKTGGRGRLNQRLGILGDFWGVEGEHNNDIDI